RANRCTPVSGRTCKPVIGRRENQLTDPTSAEPESGGVYENHSDAVATGGCRNSAARRLGQFAPCSENEILLARLLWPFKMYNRRNLEAQCKYQSLRRGR